MCKLCTNILLSKISKENAHIDKNPDIIILSGILKLNNRFKKKLSLLILF